MNHPEHREGAAAGRFVTWVVALCLTAVLVAGTVYVVASLLAWAGI